jgi:hypothetical protein
MAKTMILPGRFFERLSAQLAQILRGEFGKTNYNKRVKQHVD